MDREVRSPSPDLSGRISSASAETLREADARRLLERQGREAREATDRVRLLELERKELTQQLKGAKRALELQAEVERQCQELHIRGTVRCQQLEGSERELKEQVRALERRLAEQPEGNPEVRRLNCRLGELQGRLEEEHAISEQAEAHQQRICQDRDWWRHKFSEADRELAAAQQASADQRRALWEMESQLRRERDVAGVCTPGDYLRLARAYEHVGLPEENARLKKELLDARYELNVCKRLVLERREEGSSSELRLQLAGA